MGGSRAEGAGSPGSEGGGDRRRSERKSKEENLENKNVHKGQE